MAVDQNDHWPRWTLIKMTDVQNYRFFYTKKTDNIWFWITVILGIPNQNGRQFMNSMNNGGHFSAELTVILVIPNQNGRQFMN